MYSGNVGYLFLEVTISYISVACRRRAETRDQVEPSIYGTEERRSLAEFLQAAEDPTDAVNLLDLEIDTTAVPSFLRYVPVYLHTSKLTQVQWLVF